MWKRKWTGPRARQWSKDLWSLWALHANDRGQDSGQKPPGNEYPTKQSWHIADSIIWKQKHIAGAVFRTRKLQTLQNLFTYPTVAKQTPYLALLASFILARSKYLQMHLNNADAKCSTKNSDKDELAVPRYGWYKSYLASISLDMSDTSHTWPV